MIVDPSWTFEQALDAAWHSYPGGRQFGAPNRIKMLEQWANVVGRDRAVAQLTEALKSHPTLSAAAKAFGLSDYALRTIRRGFSAMPKVTPHVRGPSSIEQLLRSLPDLDSDSEFGFMTRVVPLLGGFLGYSESELFFEVSFPGLGRGFRVDALFAPAGPSQPRVVIEVRRGKVQEGELQRLIKQVSDFTNAAQAHAGLVLSPHVLVAVTKNRTITFIPSRGTKAELASLLSVIARPPHESSEIPKPPQISGGVGDRIESLLQAVAAAETNEQKKVSLENLAAKAFAIHPSFRCKFFNLRTTSSEIDIVCEVLSNSPFEFLRETGRYFLVECKNWAKPAGAKEIRDFLGKLRKCKVRVGVYFSRNGITGQEHGTDALREIHSAFDADGTYILVLTEQELQCIPNLTSVISLVEDKMDALRFDL